MLILSLLCGTLLTQTCCGGGSSQTPSSTASPPGSPQGPAPPSPPSPPVPPPPPAPPPIQTLCSLSADNPSVTVCTPSNSANVVSPVHVLAGTTDSNPVQSMAVYVDGVLSAQAAGSTIDAFVNLPSVGSHLVAVKAFDSASQTVVQYITVNLSPPCSLNSTIPSMTICTPTEGSTVSVPVHVVAAPNDPSPVSSMQVLVDGNTVSSLSANQFDVYLPSLTPGAHTLAISTKDAAGTTIQQHVSITVPSKSGLNNIRHIIFFLQENHSLDNYFGMMGQYRSNVKRVAADWDGLPPSVMLLDKGNSPIEPFHFQTVCTENLFPNWNPAHNDFDGGKMDNFMQSAAPASTIDPNTTRAMGYYDWTDLPYYYELAFEFATSDRFFSPVWTQTQPNRMFMFAATSFGHITSSLAPSTGWTQPTIFDNLNKANISWRYYYPDGGDPFISHWSTWSTTPNITEKVKGISSWNTDIQNESTLPSVIFIENNPLGLDEHAPENIQVGAAYAANLINALMASPSWSSSVFILSYDESGGFYDHVVPAITIKPDNIAPMLQSGDFRGDFGTSGFRVPLMVVSPWIKPHYVSHVWRDTSSILRLIEDRFGVSPLTARDANADDMIEFFDFSSPHLLTPPPLPTQPTPATLCNLSLETAPTK